MPQGRSQGSATSQSCPWRCSWVDPTVPVAAGTPAAALPRHQLRPPPGSQGAAPTTPWVARQGSSSWWERDGAKHVLG